MPLRTFGRDKGADILHRLIPKDQWDVYADVITTAREHKIRFALGGGLAFSAYSGYLRNTKDMDLFVMDDDQEALLTIMEEAGFREYTEVTYDRRWSYRGFKDGYILDILWKMLNERGRIDEVWVTVGWEVEVRGTTVQLLPPEELVWSKLYIMNRERCDWPDIINLLHVRGPAMDWERLLGRIGEDAPALGGVMSLFRWLCPGVAQELPEWIWPRMGLETALKGPKPSVERRRAALFNARDWFPMEDLV